MITKNEVILPKEEHYDKYRNSNWLMLTEELMDMHEGYSKTTHYYYKTEKDLVKQLYKSLKNLDVYNGDPDLDIKLRLNYVYMSDHTMEVLTSLNELDSWLVEHIEMDPKDLHYDDIGDEELYYSNGSFYV